MREPENGYLIIIGGAEDKKGESVILKQARELLEEGEMLTIITTATEKPEEVGQDYRKVFHRLGIRDIQVLDISTRDAANEKDIGEKIRNSQCVFMTGGDQLRITSIIGGTAAYDEIKSVYTKGGVIMGTSAGASVMSSTMVVQGQDNEPAKKCTLKMAPGLGLLDHAIIDQHFDQRGRFGRLMCGVAENPDVLGLGIDEDTAVKVYPDLHFEVLGTNSVTVMDGNTIKSSNVSELKPDEMLAIIGVTVHILPEGYGYDLNRREVIRMKKNQNANS